MTDQGHLFVLNKRIKCVAAEMLLDYLSSASALRVCNHTWVVLCSRGKGPGDRCTVRDQWWYQMSGGELLQEAQSAVLAEPAV